MSENTVISNDAVKEFFNALQYPARQAVEHYTSWYFINSIVWLIAGAVLMAMAKVIPDWRGDYGERVGLIIKCAVFVIGFLIFFANITDILAPEGMAIHQLIQDIRG